MNRPRTDASPEPARRPEDGDVGDALERALAARHREERALQLRVARLLWEVERTRLYRKRACSSIAQYGEILGRSAVETRWLAAVGHLLALRPDMEEELLSGGFSLEAGAALRRAFTDPVLVRSGVNWLSVARRSSARRLRELMEQVERAATSGQRVAAVTVVLTDSGREDLEAARRLFARKEKKLPTRGETVELLSGYFLAREDPRRKKPAPRRMPDTEGRPGRTVPAEVVRELLARHAGRCPVDLCDHRIWMDMAHRVAHRHGGSREAHNLTLPCRQHHRLLDDGVLRMEGSLERPVFRTADGRRVGQRLRPGARPPPERRGGSPCRRCSRARLPEHAAFHAAGGRDHLTGHVARRHR